MGLKKLHLEWPLADLNLYLVNFVLLKSVHTLKISYFFGLLPFVNRIIPAKFRMSNKLQDIELQR